MADPLDFFLKASYLNLDVSRPFRRSKSWCSCRRPTTTRHHSMSWASTIWCPCYIAAVVSSMADPLYFFLKASYLNSAVSRPYKRSKSWDSCQRSTTTRHHIMSWASMIWCPCYIAVVVSSMADPLDFFLKASYLNLAVPRPYTRSKSWRSCQRFTTTRHHIMSWASMVWCPCYITVVVSSMADPLDFSWQLHTWTQPFHVLTDARNHDVHVNDSRPQGIISCQEQAWFVVHATSPSLSRRWQTHQIFLESFIQHLWRFTFYKTLKIMMFMSTTNDHKALYHVLSEHDLAPKLHRCRCLVVAHPSDLS